MQNKNRDLFESVVLGLCDRVSKKPDTIFTNLDLKDELKTIEESFLATVGEFTFISAKPYDQRKMIEQYFEESYLSQYYTCVYDNLLQENALTFSTQYLLDNTQKLFNVQYLGESEDVYTPLKIIEESFVNSAMALGTAISAGAFIGLPLLPLAAVTIPTVFAIELLVPIAMSAKREKEATDLLGKVGKLLVSSKPFYIKNSSPISQSITNIANFDNLNLNDNVTELFSKLQRSMNKKDVVDGIEGLFGHCNDVIESVIQNDPNLNIEQLETLKTTKYSPTKVSILGMLYNSVMKSSSNATGGNSEQVLVYRKCIVDKLVDIYKYLVIANAVNSKDYLKIARSLSNGQSSNPEQLFSFVSSASELDQSNTTELLRENLITLLKLRLEFDNLAVGLNRGAFKIDTETGKYFAQKLKQTDIAIEDYLRTHGRKIDTLYETRREFEQKGFKHNPVNVKKSLFGFDRGNSSDRDQSQGSTRPQNPSNNQRPYPSNNQNGFQNRNNSFPPREGFSGGQNNSQSNDQQPRLNNYNNGYNGQRS